MRLFSRDKPKIKVESVKADGFSGWLKCTHCQEMIHTKELAATLNCCPKCDYHYRLSARERIGSLADKDSFIELFDEIRPKDPLQFVDTETYQARLKKAQENAEGSEGVITGTCTLDGYPVALGILDFNFMAGSMGSVVGERLTRLIELAVEKKISVIIVSASGGARMQESIFSLMQMAKTSAALARLHDAHLPFISLLTNPTLGGVTASFASLGDLIIAEPDALVGFAGPRVVEQVIRQKLPPGAQKAESLLRDGMIDCIVKRRELKARLAQFLFFLTENQREFITLHATRSKKLPSKKLQELYLLTEGAE
jgi:acetyl-CoA carboxylase carboxyl transferase subunit beta